VRNGPFDQGAMRQSYHVGGGLEQWRTGTKSSLEFDMHSSALRTTDGVIDQQTAGNQARKFWFTWSS
jgi:hypothetical protein